MCGVIGYVGRRDAATRLLSGLERLEYRGYDSAGICLLRDGRLELTKAVGKLENLKRKAGHTDGSTTGIGHTRWATHGRVTEENAHPLVAGDHDDVAIVLNGIIENHGEIRRKLVAEGEVFASETDAEVVAHLVRRAYRGSLVVAVRDRLWAAGGPFCVRGCPPRSAGAPGGYSTPLPAAGRRRRRRDVSRLVDERLRR